MRAVCTRLNHSRCCFFGFPRCLTGGNGGLPTGSCTVVRFDHLCCQLPIYYAARSVENDASFTSFFRTVYVHIFKRNEDYTQTIHNLKDEKTKVRANGLCILLVKFEDVNLL